MNNSYSSYDNNPVQSNKCPDSYRFINDSYTGKTTLLYIESGPGPFDLKRLNFPVSRATFIAVCKYVV